LQAARQTHHIQGILKTDRKHGSQRYRIICVNAEKKKNSTKNFVYDKTDVEK
jgi:hypothetical protein